MSALDDLAGAMSTITLDEMNRRAELMTRVDRKYVLPEAAAAELVAASADRVLLLEIDGSVRFDYASTYFDTAGLELCRQAALGRRRRMRVRTRSYGSSQGAWLEVKTPGPHGTTVKSRVPQAHTDRRHLAPSDRAFVSDEIRRTNITGVEAWTLEAVLDCAYRRSTLLVEETSTRVTVDTGLCWSAFGSVVRLDGFAIIETKSPPGVVSAVDRDLWRAGNRPVRMSKAGVGFGLIRPDTPGRRWRRTLNHRIAPNVWWPTVEDVA